MRSPGSQAVERTAPVPPMRPGQVERATHDDKRRGTTDLSARGHVHMADLSLGEAVPFGPALLVFGQPRGAVAPKAAMRGSAGELGDVLVPAGTRPRSKA